MEKEALKVKYEGKREKVAAISAAMAAMQDALQELEEQRKAAQAEEAAAFEELTAAMS